MRRVRWRRGAGKKDALMSMLSLQETEDQSSWGPPEVSRKTHHKIVLPKGREMEC